MRVIIRNKLFSLGGGSSVKDETGKDVFFVKGRVFSPTHVKWVCDMDKTKLYKVRNKWFNFIVHRAYVYDESGSKIARVKHHVFGGNRFVLEGYEDDIVIDGEFFSLRSTIMKNGEPIGTIDRQITLFKDAFALEGEEEDMPFLIALVIAIDNIVDDIMRS